MNSLAINAGHRGHKRMATSRTLHDCWSIVNGFEAGRYGLEVADCREIINMIDRSRKCAA